ncbi:MAG: hypothetical protein BWY65_01033 [Firmicutes bacterium ADurb.Bin373]|nr:hypothetical protein [Bacillota bacterium]OQA09588.1 MAG: hypothetical protein BWY65_01033 [Firmicutes bacterium ADurb.Bin373]
MSKEQALRFMLLTEGDEDLKREFRSIVNRYKVKNLTEQEQEKIILEEMIPLAGSKGFDLSTEDFKELLQSVEKQLTDAELGQAVGGRGQFLVPATEHIIFCELAPDDETFLRIYKGSGDVYCPSHEYIFRGMTYGRKSCSTCKHYQKK